VFAPTNKPGGSHSTSSAARPQGSRKPPTTGKHYKDLKKPAPARSTRFSGWMSDADRQKPVRARLQQRIERQLVNLTVNVLPSLPALPAPTVPAAKMRTPEHASSMLKALGLSLGLGIASRPGPEPKRAPALGTVRCPPTGPRLREGLPPPARLQRQRPSAAPPARSAPHRALPTPHRDSPFRSAKSRIPCWLSAAEIQSGARMQDLRTPGPVAIGDPKTPHTHGTLLPLTEQVSILSTHSTRTAKVNPHGWTECDHSGRSLGWLQDPASNHSRIQRHGLGPSWVDSAPPSTNGCVRMKQRNTAQALRPGGSRHRCCITR